MPRSPTYRRDIACARLLMDEYGVPKDKLDGVLDHIARVYDCVRMPHFVIVRSVRGFLPIPQTRPLENFLEQHKTHPPKHNKGQMERRPEFRGRYEEPSYD